MLQYALTPPLGGGKLNFGSASDLTRAALTKSATVYAVFAIE